MMDLAESRKRDALHRRIQKLKLMIDHFVTPNLLYQKSRHLPDIIHYAGLMVIHAVLVTAVWPLNE